MCQIWRIHVESRKQFTGTLQEAENRMKMNPFRNIARQEAVCKLLITDCIFFSMKMMVPQKKSSFSILCYKKRSETFHCTLFELKTGANYN